MKTKTIFRRFPQGDVIALFPEIPADCRGHHCESYQIIGQHGAASPDIPNTIPATPEEYAATLAELKHIGYNVAIVRRISQAMHRTRYAAAIAR